MRNLILTAVLASTIAAGTAHAVPTTGLELMVNGTTVNDNGRGDVDPTTGAITYIGSTGNFSTSVQTGSATNLPGLDLSDVLITSTGAGTLVIELTDTGLTSPAGVTSWLTQSTGNMTGGAGTVQVQTYFDATDKAFGTGTLLANLTSSSSVFDPTEITGSAGGSPFSLTEIVTVTTTGSGTNFSLDSQLSNVPEPASLALLATTLVGVGALRRRKSHA